MIKKGAMYVALSFFSATYISSQTVSQTPITISGFSFVDLNKDGQLQPYEDTRLSVDKRIEDLINRLSLEEKVKLTFGTGMKGIDALASVSPVVGATDFIVPGAAGTTYPLPNWGIPALVMTDGPAGVRIRPTRANDFNTYYATGFPIGTLLASTWDIDIVKRIGESIGNEALEYGSDVQLTPGMNIMRNPLCGRNFEYYSEDPLLTGKIASAMVRGVQANGVGASAKHYAANNSESNRMAVDIRASQRALREIYLKGFEIVVKESNPATVMSAYNKLNGVATSADYDLLTTVLRNEWGFKGLVVTDWFGGFAGLKDVFTGKGESLTIQQFASGNDLLMPGLLVQEKDILEGLKAGKLSQDDFNLALKRILRMIFQSPKMQGYAYSNKPNLKSHAQIARQVASEGMVLLKNNAHTLPISSKQSKVALFGISSYNLIAGGTGSGDVHKAYVIPLDKGLQDAGFIANNNLKDIYSPYLESQEAILVDKRKAFTFPIALNIPEMEVDASTIEKLALTEDLAILTIGRNSGEFVDRKIENDFNLSQTEQDLLSNISRAFRAKGKRVIVVLNIGGVIETATWKDKADAILVAWQPGQEGGYAIADILTGATNPSGKLTMTFPIDYTDAPSSATFPGIPADKPDYEEYKEGIYVGYRYFDTFDVQPSFEFGYGLSYTNFTYSDICIQADYPEEGVYVMVKVKNTGKVSGREVVQLYLDAPKGAIDKPKRELKGFRKTKLLGVGQEQTIVFEISPKELASFNTPKSAWIADKGIYTVQVSSSISASKQSTTFSLLSDIEVEKVNNVLNSTGVYLDLKPNNR
ncbi:MAG: hypothetical protein RL662_2345 [Bacteroidota bacterium]